MFDMATGAPAGSITVEGTTGLNDITVAADGTIYGKPVQVNTISPEKVSDQEIVKSQGNFAQLLIVRIDENFEFAGKLIDRDELADGGGRFLKARMQEFGGL